MSINDFSVKDVTQKETARPFQMRVGWCWGADLERLLFSVHMRHVGPINESDSKA